METENKLTFNLQIDFGINDRPLCFSSSYVNLRVKHMLLVLVRHVSSLKFEFGIREFPIALFVPHKITSAPRAIRSCFSLQVFWVANIYLLV